MPLNWSRRMATLAAPILFLGTLAGITVGPMANSQATALSCAEGWTTIDGTVCELTVTTSGSVTIPDGVPSVDIVAVVGGGGGGGVFAALPGLISAGGGGGGGEVVNCLAVGLSGTVSVTVGEGGTGGGSNSDGAATPPSGADGSDGTAPPTTTTAPPTTTPASTTPSPPTTRPGGAESPVVAPRFTG
jgi:hypothetical protein